MHLSQLHGPLPSLPVSKNTWFLHGPGNCIPAREVSGYPCYLASSWLYSDELTAGGGGGGSVTVYPRLGRLLSLCMLLHTLTPLLPKVKNKKSILDSDPAAQSLLEISGRTRHSEGLREVPEEDD